MAVAGPPISSETPTVAEADARDLAAAAPLPRCFDPAWDGCFAAHNLAAAPDDPAFRPPPRPDLPRFA